MVNVTCPDCGNETPLLPNTGSIEQTGEHYAEHTADFDGKLRMCPRSFVTYQTDDLVPIQRDERGRVIR